MNFLKNLYKSKYKNQKTYVDGIKFDSKKEAERYKVLKIMELSGAIKNLRLQVPFEVIPAQEDGQMKACNYIADFVHKQDGRTIIEDVKGYRSEVYRIKKKLMKWRFDMDIKEM